MIILGIIIASWLIGIGLGVCMANSFYNTEKELMKSDLIADIAHAIADNPFILEAIENAILEEFPEIAETWDS